jgi:hypothetical protein
MAAAAEAVLLKLNGAGFVQAPYCQAEAYYRMRSDSEDAAGPDLGVAGDAHLVELSADGAQKGLGLGVIFYRHTSGIEALGGAQQVYARNAKSEVIRSDDQALAGELQDQRQAVVRYSHSKPGPGA